MKKTFPILALAIVFLFFIQSSGTLIESIYILDLMNTKVDAKVLGLLFFFLPLLLIPLFKKSGARLLWIVFAVLFVARGVFPFLPTTDRMLASGIATGAAMSLFLLLLRARPGGEKSNAIGLWASAGLALAVGLSVLFRTVYYGLDYSLTPTGAWSGIVLGLLLGGVIVRQEVRAPAEEDKEVGGVTLSIVGIFLVLTLVYFAFSAPSVIARWTEGNYTLIVLTVSLLATGWVLVSLLRPQLFRKVGPAILITWNLAFTVCLTATILVHGVAFPATPGSPVVTVGSPTGWQVIPLVGMLLLYPVLFLDLECFLNRVQAAAPTPGQLVPGIMLGSASLMLLIFFNIFSNIWGYVEPVSGFFRGKFWLAFLLPAAGISLLAWSIRKSQAEAAKEAPAFHWGWGIILVGIFAGTFVRALPSQKVEEDEAERSSITVMTYNIQGANDANAEKSFERQLALIRKVSPDILSMQETDTARISFNNNDFVRFYAESLGYYSYYGPTTVSGTFGTAILSKYPLQDIQSVFTFSDTDEIGVAEAVVNVTGREIHIYNVHPDGSDTAKMAFAEGLLSRTKGQEFVIALGDYNLRDYEAPYQLIDSVLTNAWTSVYPSKISPDGVDMSGDNRIDHIFLSPALAARNPVYLLPPASATDHPVHWAEIYWTNP